MSFAKIVEWAAQGALKAVGSPLGSTPVGDIEAVISALGAAISHIQTSGMTFTDAESIVNAIQEILVNAGIEPGVVATAIKVAETLIPFVVQGYQSGTITGGYRPVVGGFAGARGHI